jgi:urease beta subunit
MIPGEYFLDDGDIPINAGRRTVTLVGGERRRPPRPGRLALPFS